MTSTTFIFILQLIFITLKLTKVISWSWLWVLAPIWISICVTIGVLLGVFILYLLFRER